MATVHIDNVWQHIYRHIQIQTYTCIGQYIIFWIEPSPKYKALPLSEFVAFWMA